MNRPPLAPANPGGRGDPFFPRVIAHPAEPVRHDVADPAQRGALRVETAVIHDLLSVGRAPEVIAVDVAERLAGARHDEQVVLEACKPERPQAGGQTPDLVSIPREIERGA